MFHKIRLSGYLSSAVALFESSRNRCDPLTPLATVVAGVGVLALLRATRSRHLARTRTNLRLQQVIAIRIRLDDLLDRLVERQRPAARINQRHAILGTSRTVIADHLIIFLHLEVILEGATRLG